MPKGKKRPHYNWLQYVLLAGTPPDIRHPSPILAVQSWTGLLAGSPEIRICNCIVPLTCSDIAILCRPAGRVLLCFTTNDVCSITYTAVSSCPLSPAWGSRGHYTGVDNQLSEGGWRSSPKVGSFVRFMVTSATSASMLTYHRR